MLQVGAYDRSQLTIARHNADGISIELQRERVLFSSSVAEICVLYQSSHNVVPCLRLRACGYILRIENDQSNIALLNPVRFDIHLKIAKPTVIALRLSSA